MCDCKAIMMEKFKEFYPDAENVTAINYEIMSGRSYSEYEIKLSNKKKPIERLLLHSYCPHCGKPYEATDSTEVKI